MKHRILKRSLCTLLSIAMLYGLFPSTAVASNVETLKESVSTSVSFAANETKTFALQSATDGLYVLYANNLCSDEIEFTDCVSIMDKNQSQLPTLDESYQRLIIKLEANEYYTIHLTNPDHFAKECMIVAAPLSGVRSLNVLGSVQNPEACSYTYTELNWSGSNEMTSHLDCSIIAINVPKGGWYNFYGNEASSGRVEIYTSGLEYVKENGWNRFHFGPGDSFAPMYLEAGQYYALIYGYDLDVFYSEYSDFASVSETTAAPVYMTGGDYPIAYVTFVPSETGNYLFHAEVPFVDTYSVDAMRVYDADGHCIEQVEYGFDEGFSGDLSVFLTAGKTYYLAVQGYGQGKASVSRDLSEAVDYSVYPENGCILDLDHPENGTSQENYADGKPRIFFDHELIGISGRPKLDFTRGTLKVYRAADGKQIYAVSESATVPGTSTDVTLWGTSTPYTAIRLEGLKAVLEYNTEYYVVVPEGFVKFSDGSASPAINKGDWTFRTASSEISSAPELPVYSQDEQEVMEQAMQSLDTDHLLPDISFGMDELKGPEVTVAGNTFYLFDIASKVEIPVGEKVTIQAKANTEEKTVTLLLGYKPVSDGMTIVGDPNSEEAYDPTTGEKIDYWNAFYSAKSLYKTLGGTEPASSAAFRSKFQNMYDAMQEFDMDLIVQATGRVCGYAEFSYETGQMKFSEGGAILAVSLEKTLNHRIPATFSIGYVTLRFNASAEGKLLIVQEERQMNTDLQLDAALGTAVGVGLGKNTGALQAYVEGGLEGVLDVAARPWRIAGVDEEEPLTVSVTGKLYLEWRVKLGLSIGQPYEKQLLKFQLYPSLERLDLEALERVIMKDYVNSSSPIPRTYLNQASLMAYSDDFSYYTAVFPYAEPSLFDLGDGRKLMVWVGDTGKKADEERTSILYSVYSNGSWSAEQVIHENGAYNDHPVLCQEGDSIHLVWTRADSPIGDDWENSTTTMLEHMELCFCTFDVNTLTWGNETVISEKNALAETDYAVASGNGETVVVWLENSLNDMLMNGGTNTVYLRALKDGRWGEIQTLTATDDPIYDLTVSVGSNGWTATYSICSDQETTTWTVSQGNQAEIVDGVDYSVQQVNGALYYLKGTELFCNGVSTGLDGISNFQIISSNGRTAVLSLIPTGLTCELFGSYYDNSTNTWGPWRQLTGFNMYIRSYSAILDESGKIVAALNLAEVNDDTNTGYVYGTAYLAVVDDCTYSDIAISDWVSYDPADVVYQGIVPLTFEVTNNSNADLAVLPVQLLEAGNVVWNYRIEQTIPAGGSVRLTVDCPMGPTTMRNITVRLRPDDGLDDNLDNNSAVVQIQPASDVAVTLESPELVNGKAILTAAVSNGANRADAEQVELTVYNSNRSGEVLFTKELGTLAAEERQEIRITLPNKYLFLDDPETMHALQAEVTVHGAETDYANNSDRVAFGALLPWQVTSSMDEENILTVTASVDSDQPDGQMILALYKENGQMAAVRCKDISSGESTSFTIPCNHMTEQSVVARLFWLSPFDWTAISTFWEGTFDIE